MRISRVCISLGVMLLVLVACEATCHAAPSKQTKVLQRKLLAAYAQWEKLNRRLMARWNPKGSRPIIERWNKVMTGYPGGETIAIDFSYGGGSAASLEFRVINPKYGVIFETRAGDMSDVLLVDLYPKRKGVEIVTAHYRHVGGYTPKEAAAIKRLPSAQFEMGIPIDLTGPRGDPVSECHFCAHRYVAEVWAWDASMHRYAKLGTYSTKRLYYSDSSHRHMLMEVAAGLSSLRR